MSVYIAAPKGDLALALQDFCESQHTTKKDLIVFVGVDGYHLLLKTRKQLEALPATFIFARGLALRPKAYRQRRIIHPSFTGSFWLDNKFPDLLVASENTIFSAGGQDVFVMDSIPPQKLGRHILDWLANRPSKPRIVISNYNQPTFKPTVDSGRWADAVERLLPYELWYSLSNNNDLYCNGKALDCEFVCLAEGA